MMISVGMLEITYILLYVSLYKTSKVEGVICAISVDICGNTGSYSCFCVKTVVITVQYLGYSFLIYFTLEPAFRPNIYC